MIEPLSFHQEYRATGSEMRSPSLDRSTIRLLLGGILALAAAMGIGRFAYTPILPAMLAAGTLDIVQAGLLAAANYAGYLAGALLAILVPAESQARLLRLSAVAVVATTALMAFSSNVILWGGVRFLAGLASAGVLVLASGIVLDELRRQGCPALSGWLYSGVGLGIVVSGSVIWVTAGTLGWRGDWIILSALATVALLISGIWLPRSAILHSPAHELPLSRALAQPALLLLCAAYFLEGLGYVVTGTFLVTIVAQTPGQTALGAAVWILVGLAVIPSAALWTLLAGRIGFVPALTTAYLLQAAGIILPLAGGAGAALAAALLFGGTFAGITALTLTLAALLIRQRSAGLVGLLTALFGLGQMIGPVIAAAIVGQWHTFAPALLAASALVAVGGLLMALLRPFAPR